MSKSINNKTHSRIVECALKLFREEGYDNVTIQEICQNSKITKSTFYYHFPSKESLIEEFTEQTSRTTQENFAEIMALESNILQLWAIF
ncbi:TetR/AcrR family transcriptional regulator [Lacrimispora xylanisolvens]|uniref:TetR/AcrR family transcriptional regulator n=1 Tax=Lacrimispora xylanisolvens TaxID=384636 RepID=UPI00240295AD